MKVLEVHRIRFGAFEFDRLNRLLYRDGAELSLPPRAVGVLSCLLDRPGQIVPKQVLLDEVWKDANVTETSLTEAVSLLRQILIDDPQRPTFIQTVPRRGYRFVAPAQAGAQAPEIASAMSGATVAEASAPGTMAGSLPTVLPGVPPGGSTAVAPHVVRGDAVTGAADAGVSEPAWPAWLPWMFLLISLAVFGSIIVAVLRQPSTYARPVVRFVIDLPAGLALAADGPSMALSRSGQQLAFVARRADGVARLYVRDMDRLDAVLLEGTEGAAAPFFSPDGRWVGFFAGGALKKVPAAGGAAIVLCDARAALGGAWTTRRTIVFAGSLTGGLSRVHEDGGAPVSITTPDAQAGEVRHAWPGLLPGDAGVLFTGVPLAGGPEASRIAALSFDTGRLQTLVDGGVSPHYAPTGHLLFARDRAIVAAPFDPDALELLGPAVPVLDNIATSDTRGAAEFVVAPGGHAAAVRVARPETTAAYQWIRLDGTPPAGAAPADTAAAAVGATNGTPSAGARAREVRAGIDSTRDAAGGAAGARDSTVVPAFTAPFPSRAIRGVALSPDAGRLAVSLGDGHRTDIWVSDLTRSDLQRLTTDGQNVAPVWTSDGRRVIYASRRDAGPFALFARTLDDAVAAAIPVDGTARQPLPLSTSTNGMIYVDAHPRTGLDLWFMPWSGGPARPLLQTPFDETNGAISPDGRWLAYQSNASGPWTAMVRAIVSTPAAEPASTPTAGSATNANAATKAASSGNKAAADEDDGVRLAETDGGQLGWSPDGRRVLFTHEGRLLAIDAKDSKDAKDAIDADGAEPARVLATDINAASGFGITRDGRVLVRRRDASQPPARLEVVLDWTRELSAKVPIRPRTPRPVR